MAFVDITDLRVKISPEIAAPEYRGTPDDYGVHAQAIPLTREAITERGGVPYTVGDDWQIKLRIGYIEDNAWVTANLDSCSAYMTIVDRSSNAVIETRDSDVAAEMVIANFGSDDNITIKFANTETPTAGTHKFYLVMTWSDSTKTTLRGWIDILKAVPT